MKRYKRGAAEIGRLVEGLGSCIASDRITVDGVPVGVMVREVPEHASDSGWIFLAGDETQAYLDDPGNLALYDVNTIANYDPSIIPFLYALPGQKYARGPSGAWVEEEDSAGLGEEVGAPAWAVVQGRITVQARWSLVLPTPFRLLLVDGHHRLWRPCLTICVEDLGDRLVGLTDPVAGARERMSPGAHDVRERRDGRLMTLSYRLQEDTTSAGVPSLYAYALGKTGALWIAVYADREDDVMAARSILESVQER